MKNEIFTNNKIYAHLDKVQEWVEGENPYPVVVELDITNKCNNKCPQCVGFNENGKELTSKQVITMAKELKKCGVKAICLSGGGEPLMHPEFFDILHRLKELGFEIGLITNGTLIKKENACNIIKNCKWVRVSVDAHDDDEYLKTHGVALFQKVKDGIRCLVAEKKLNPECVIGAAYLIGGDNFNNLEKYVVSAKELGVTYCQFRPFHHTNAKINKDQMVALKTDHQTEYFKVVYSQHKYENLELERPYDTCYGHQFTTVICADYKVYICCHMRSNPKYCLGDLNKDTFGEIWNSEQRKKVYENIDFKDCPPVCRCDTFNCILDNIKKAKNQTHKNFL